MKLNYQTLFMMPIWVQWLNSLQLPCKYEMTKEHVIPKSILPRNITSQSHNIIGLPARLNNKRSNLKYVESQLPGIPIWPCKECRNPSCRLMGKLNKEGFTPPDIYKPVIGASVLRSMYNNPFIVEVVHNDVLDLGLALEWTNGSYEGLPDDIKGLFL